MELCRRIKWVLGSEFLEDARSGEPLDAFPSGPNPVKNYLIEHYFKDYELRIRERSLYQQAFIPLPVKKHQHRGEKDEHSR